jgi:putative membrane protein
MMGNGSGMGGMWWYWLFGLLVVLGITLLVVVLVRVLGGGTNRSGSPAGLGAPPAGPSQARRILDERYARGELSKEEYREHLQELGEDA